MPTGCDSRFIAGKAWLCVVCSPMQATLTGAAAAARPRKTKSAIEPAEEPAVRKPAEPGRRHAHDIQDRGAEPLVRLCARVDEVAGALEPPRRAAEEDHGDVLLIVRPGGLLVAPDDERRIERRL